MDYTLCSQSTKLTASMLYLQRTHTFTSHKKKVWVLILFMKTPKIFLEIMGESVCAL